MVPSQLFHFIFPSFSAAHKQAGADREVGGLLDPNLFSSVWLIKAHLPDLFDQLALSIPELPSQIYVHVVGVSSRLYCVKKRMIRLYEGELF